MKFRGPVDSNVEDLLLLFDLLWHRKGTVLELLKSRWSWGGRRRRKREEKQEGS